MTNITEFFKIAGVDSTKGKAKQICENANIQSPDLDMSNFTFVKVEDFKLGDIMIGATRLGLILPYTITKMQKLDNGIKFEFNNDSKNMLILPYGIKMKKVEN